MAQKNSENKLKELRDVLSSQVRMARADMRLSQVEVAEKAGTTQTRVSEIEIGNANPRLSTIARIAGVLGLRITVDRAA